ncbi:NADH-dependent flavin oxidoreductase, partial [Lacticaseibacillus rhamnosus MTCC 5462]
MSDYTFLKPFTFKNQPITLKNRIVIPPMTTRLSLKMARSRMTKLNTIKSAL